MNTDELREAAKKRIAEWRKHFEGFWNDENNFYPQYPVPVHSDTAFEGKQEILDRLNLVERTAEKMSYMGLSVCRCCDPKVTVGSSEFILRGWVWPIGFRHYIEVHNVKPSDAFIKDLLRL